MQLEAPESGNAQIKQLLQLLFQEIQAFGIFAAVGEADKAHIEDYMRMRVSIISFIIKTLELGTEQFGQSLIIDEEAWPFLYNNADWPENAPIAGYCKANGSIKYSQLLHTYVGNWHYESEHDEPIDSRLMLASLWIWYNQDFKSALKYLFDLQKYGYLTKGLFGIITMLIQLQALGRDTPEIVAAYFDGEMPLNNADWLNKKPGTPFQTLIGLDKKPDEAIVQSILGSIVMDTLKEIKQARMLTDPIFWMLEQANIILRCRLVLQLFVNYSLKPTIMLKSIIDQFDEISADGGIYRIYNERIRKDFRPLNSPMTVQLGYLPAMFRAQFGDEAENRLYQERLIYPAILRNSVQESFKDETSSKVILSQEEWVNIPPRIVTPFMAALGNVPPLLTLRKNMFPLDQIEQEPEIQSFFQNNNIQSEQDRRNLLEESYLGYLPAQLLSEQPDAFTASKEQEKEFITLLSSVHQSLCQQELLDKIESSWQLKDIEEKKQLLEQIHFLYPWSFTVFQELCIFDDQRERIQQAWEYILTAMVLSLDNPEVWHSFGVIVNRMGNSNDAKLAIAVSQYLQEQKKDE